MLVDLPNALSYFGIERKGIIHVGAHYGQEIAQYQKLQFKNIVAFEASKKNFDVLTSKVSSEAAVLVNKALGPKPGFCDLNVETKNEGMSNSILAPKLHLEQYPHITFNEVERVEMTTLDSWKSENAPDVDYNVICMDVQGFEFEVLLGSSETLKNVDCLVCEVNRAELYKDGAHVTEIDLYLRTYGLRRVMTNWEGQTWGDACYVHEKFIVKMNASMPKVGLVDMNFSHAPAVLGFDSACLLPTAKFDWERNIRNINLSDQIGFVVFTDQMIENAQMINGKRKIAWLIEPAEVNSTLRERARSLAHHFDAIITHDKALISTLNNGHYSPIACSWIRPQDWYVHEKSKLVSIIASSKSDTSGQKLRHEASRLILEDDRFGSAYKKIDNKVDALKDYKFSVVIENCKQEGFFTEKIVDSLIVGTVPIYWGCNDIGDYFDKRGIIQFDTLDDLQKILSSDLESFYNERREHIISNSKLARRFASCDEMLINKIIGVQ